MAAFTSHADVGGANVGLRAQAVGQDAPVDHLRDHALHDRVIDAQHRETVKRNAADKGLESLMQGGDIAIEIKMLGIDVGDHRRRRRQPGKGAVTLIGLDDHPIAGAEPGVGTVGVDDAAIDYRRIEPAGFQEGADHRGRRRLTMRAGDRDRPFQPHQFGQHLGAPHHRHAPRPRRDDFGIIGLDRRGHDDDLGGIEIFRAMADRDANAEFSEPLCIGALGEIAALHLVTEIVQDLGDAAHADAADPDEMQGAD